MNSSKQRTENKQMKNTRTKWITLTTRLAQKEPTTKLGSLIQNFAMLKSSAQLTFSDRLLCKLRKNRQDWETFLNSRTFSRSIKTKSKIWPRNSNQTWKVSTEAKFKSSSTANKCSRMPSAKPNARVLLKSKHTRSMKNRCTVVLRRSELLLTRKTSN
jgi:hypothetical protein